MLDGFFGTHSSISPATPLVQPEEVVDYAAVVDRYCRACIRSKELQSKREAFIFNYPSLFFWSTLPDSGVRVESVEWWAQR